MDYAGIQRRLAVTGLVARGGFIAGADEALPIGARTIVLVGDLGGAFWPRFRAEQRDEVDPLDAWTRRVLSAAARELGARAIYPFDGPPYHPFQQWAMRAEGLRQSPIGPLIHPEYGPWHSYRGALLFDDAVAGLPTAPQTAHPCDTCRARPCLSACPVGAFAGGGFDLGACLGHLKSDAGKPCMAQGCRARNVCPVGQSRAYAPDHQAFLARGFVASFGD